MRQTIGRDVCRCREVIVQQAGLHAERFRRVQLLKHVAPEEGSVERHVVNVQQLRSASHSARTQMSKKQYKFHEKTVLTKKIATA